MLTTRIIWSDTDADGRVLEPLPRSTRWYHWAWMVALIGFSAWAFVGMPW